MNNKQPQKKFNWSGAIIVLIIAALIGVGIWYFAFRKTEKTITAGQLQTNMEEAATSTADDHYFKEFKTDLSLGKIYVVEHKTTGTDEYVVGITDADFINRLSNIKTASGDPITVDAFKNGAKVEGGVAGTIYKAPSFWWTLLQQLFIYGIIFFVIILVMRKMTGGAGGSNSPFNAGRNRARKTTSDKTFADVAGNAEVKEEVSELVDFLKKPSKYKAAGARIPKGILLGGPPGTGKTLIAKATAGEAGVPFYFISGSNFVEMFVGVGAKRVREMFKEVRKSSPAIIFIDELDAVGRSRGAGLGGGNDEREQTLNQLLVEMDGMDTSLGVLIIAATNRPDVLDPALLRPGRFDRVITVGLPDIKEREAILKVHAKGKRLAPSIKFDKLAKRTPGYSGAQLENVINEASLLSVRENTGVITPAQIDEAIDRVMAGPAKKSRTITLKEQTMVAYHEAGHAVCGIKVPGGRKVQKITIIPRGNAGGYNLMMPEEEKFNYSKSDLMAQLISFMGGRAAEQIMYGKGEVSTGASNDIEQATKIARSMVTKYGMSELGAIQYEADQGGPFIGRDLYKSKDFSDKVGYEIDVEVRKFINSAEKKAFEVIRKNKKLLEAIKNVLLQQETIVAEEIEYVAKHYKLPPKKKEKVIKASKKSLKELIKETHNQTLDEEMRSAPKESGSDLKRSTKSKPKQSTKSKTNKSVKEKSDKPKKD